MTKNKAVYSVLIALSVGHLINDTIQSLLPAIYPIIKANYQLDFTQIGMLTFVFQMCGSIFQPMVGHYTDKKPMPYSMVVGMGFSMAGLITLALAHDYAFLLVGSAMVGIGSSIFHPEATRLARRASGGQVGFAQAVFVVGGQTGSAIGPLLAVFVIVTGGQSSIAWFSLIALLGMVILAWAGRWHIRSNIERAKNATAGAAPAATTTIPAAAATAASFRAPAQVTQLRSASRASVDTTALTRRRATAAPTRATTARPAFTSFRVRMCSRRGPM